MRTSIRNYWLLKNWILVFSLFYGIFLVLPFLAPLFMKIGWQYGAKIIYGIYSFLCHQLPQRSFFLFGENSMYTLSTIQLNWQNTINPMVLRKFVGNLVLGWKVAWSDRMVYMYSSILPISWVWFCFRKKLKEFPLWLFFILLFLMAIDGFTHFISDLAGLGQGFRDTNKWLATLTNYKFSPNFYLGDEFGSFNSWMRLFTGVTFGIAIVGIIFPYLEEIFDSIKSNYKRKFEELEKINLNIKEYEKRISKK